MNQELIDKINSELDYGDNRSAWVRDAIQLKFEILEALEDADGEMTDEERREFVREAVERASERDED
jgi:hypothetical protein